MTIYNYLFLFSGVVVLLSFVYLIITYLFIKVPYIKTPRVKLKSILEEINWKDKVVYDLGCGTGAFLFAVERLGADKLIGYELSPLFYWLARLRKFFYKSKVDIRFENFFQADISQADIIYLFLVPRAVQTVWRKIKREAKTGSLVIVLADSINGEIPFKTKKVDGYEGSIYFYKVSR